MLGIVVSFFDTSESQIVVRYLEGKSLIKVDSEHVSKAILDVLDNNDIPRTNLVSVLMDSCNVMRG